MAKRVQSPSGQKDFFCDSVGAEALIALYRRDRSVLLVSEDQEMVVFDGGGACIAGEPDIAFEVPGLRARTPVTQFIFILETLRSAKEYKGSGSVAFGGWMGFYYVISLGVRDLLVAEMERLWPACEAEAKKWEESVLIGLKQAGIVDHRRKISDVEGS